MPFSTSFSEFILELILGTSTSSGYWFSLSQTIHFPDLEEILEVIFEVDFGGHFGLPGDHIMSQDEVPEEAQKEVQT